MADHKCETCNGRGLPEGASTEIKVMCEPCNGSGVIHEAEKEVLEVKPKRKRKRKQRNIKVKSIDEKIQDGERVNEDEQSK